MWIPTLRLPFVPSQSSCSPGRSRRCLLTGDQSPAFPGEPALLGTLRASHWPFVALLFPLRSSCRTPVSPASRIQERNLLNARVLVQTDNQHVRQLLSLSLVRLPSLSYFRRGSRHCYQICLAQPHAHTTLMCWNLGLRLAYRIKILGRGGCDDRVQAWSVRDSGANSNQPSVLTRTSSHNVDALILTAML